MRDTISEKLKCIICYLMYMTSIPIIEESLEVLESLLRQEKQAVKKQRLHLLVLLKQGILETWQAIAQQLAVHRNTLRTWLAAYQSGGLEKLLQMDARGAPQGQRSLSAEVIKTIKQRLEDPAGVSGYVELHHWLMDEHQVQIPYKTLYHIVRYQLKAKLKVPRAKHTKQDDKQIPSPGVGKCTTLYCPQ